MAGFFARVENMWVGEEEGGSSKFGWGGLSHYMGEAWGA